MPWGSTGLASSFFFAFLLVASWSWSYQRQTCKFTHKVTIWLTELLQWWSKILIFLAILYSSSYTESWERWQRQRPSPSSTKTWNLGMSPIAKPEIQKQMNWTSSPESGGSIEDLSLTKAYKNNLIIDGISKSEKRPDQAEEALGRRRWAFRSVPSLGNSARLPSTRSSSPRPLLASSDGSSKMTSFHF